MLTYEELEHIVDTLIAADVNLGEGTILWVHPDTPWEHGITEDMIINGIRIKLSKEVPPYACE